VNRVNISTLNGTNSFLASDSTLRIRGVLVECESLQTAGRKSGVRPTFPPFQSAIPRSPENSGPVYVTDQEYAVYRGLPNVL
jgi:hypothetical protein